MKNLIAPVLPLRRIGKGLSVLLLCLMTGLLPSPGLTTSKSSWVTQSIQSLQQSKKRWIEVNLTSQRLIAWEGRKQVYAVIVSTGKDGSPTRTGVFAIQSRYRLARMQGVGYDVPDVPYTMYYSGSYAIHGTYWHRQFGNAVSHGCVNVAVDHARWLFNWSDIGTPVVVHY